MPKIKIFKGVLRSEINHLDLLYKELTDAKFNHPFKDYTNEQNAFDDYKDFLLTRYGFNHLRLLRRVLMSKEHRGFMDSFINCY